MEIVWTEFAYDTLFETLLFVRKKWSHRVVWGVRKAIYDKVLSLKNFPLQGEKVIVECREEVDVRILLVNKRTKIFYFIYSEKVYDAYHGIKGMCSRQEKCSPKVFI